MQLPEKQDDAAEMHKTEEVLRSTFPASRDPAPTFQPSEQSFDFPATLVATELATVLLAFAGRLLRSNEFDATLFFEAKLKRVAIPRLVGNQSRRQLLHESSVESSFGEHTVESVSCCNMDSEWKTIAVCERHEFRRPASPAFADAGPPFFAGT